jgi:hypothetical protein
MTSKEVKIGSDLAESSKERYGSKRAVLRIMMMMMIMMILYLNQRIKIL